MGELEKLHAKSIDTGALLPALWLSLLPIAEALFFRLYLHFILDLRIGWKYAVDSDFLFPVPMAFVLLILVLAGGKALRISLHRTMLILNVGLAAGFLVLNHYYMELHSTFPRIFPLIWWGGLSALLASACFVWVRPSFFWKNPNRHALLPCLLIAFSLVIQKNVTEIPWRRFGSTIGRQVGALTTPLTRQEVRIVEKKDQDGSTLIVLAHPRYQVSIGRGCAGFDGMFVFGSALLLAWMLEKKKGFLNWIALGIAGFSLMHIINLIRLSGLFLISVWLKERGMLDENVKICSLLWHTHSGWILYGISLGSFFYLAFFRTTEKRTFAEASQA